jgi:hypothetical protein
MARQVRVEIKDAPGPGSVLQVVPGTVELWVNHNDTLLIENSTKDSVSVWFPEPLFTTNKPVSVGSGKQLELKLMKNPPRGPHSYAVHASGGPTPGGRFAIGNSAPGVIIKP